MLVIDRNRLGVCEFPCVSIEVLKDHLGVWVGNESFAAKLLGHIENIIDLNHAKVGVETLQSW